MKRIKYFLIVIVFLSFIYIVNLPHPFPPLLNKERGWGEVQLVKIAGQNVKVDLALTKETRTQGLSGRKDLKENEGMLFIFDRSGNYPFWMKDMFFPIDIIWLAPSEIGGDNSKAKVIYIKKDAKPESYPEIYGPQNVPTPKGVGIPTASVGTKYILEVVSGFSDKNNLKVGDEVLFTY